MSLLQQDSGFPSNWSDAEGFDRSYDTESDRIARHKVSFPELPYMLGIGVALLVALVWGWV